MKFLAMDRILPGATPETIYPHMHAEAVKAWELYKSGAFRELYFRQDHPGVVLIMECASVEEAHEALKTLPLVEAGLVAFDVIPIGPFMPFEMLFAAS